MARKRNIHPNFFINEDLGELQPLARLLLIGIWTLADREGRLEDRPKKIRAEVLPYDTVDGEELLTDIAAKGFIIRYEVDSKKYIQINNWDKYQDVHPKETESKIPPMLAQEQSRDNLRITQGTPKDDPQETQGDSFNPIPSFPSITSYPSLVPPISSFSEDFSESVFDGLTIPDNAKAAHDKVIEWLTGLGYDCQREVYVDDRGDGRRGRIDLVAINDKHMLAIEIDQLTPREKSVFKLKQVDGFIKIILLRGITNHQSIPGIDFIIAIPLENDTNEAINYQDVVDEYNDTCPKMPKAIALSKDRKSAIRSRITEYSRQAITDVLRYVSGSPHHNGSNERGWTADFDWIMGPKNFRKLYERAKSGAAPPTGQGRKMTQREIDDIERRRLAEEYDRNTGQQANRSMQSKLPSVLQY